MNNSAFRIITSLQYRLRAAQAEIQAFLSGEQYVRMEEAHQKDIASYKRLVKKLKAELADARRSAVKMRDHWFQVFEDLQKEMEQLKATCNRKLRELEKRALKAESQRDEALDKITEQRRRLYELATELEEEKGKNQALKAQLNRDYENSSFPSSQTAVKKKKITNNREKTGRRPGGQPGHPAHGRKRQTPTEPLVLLPPPPEVLDDRDFRRTSKTIIKQLIASCII